MRSPNEKPVVIMAGPHPPPPGGMANFIHDLETSEITRTHDIKPFDTDYPRRIKKIRPLALAYLPIMFSDFSRSISNYYPDIAHIHTPSFKSFYKHALMLSIARKRGIASVLHAHGGKFKEFYESLSDLKKADVRKKLADADRLIVLSDSWKEFFACIYPSQKIRVVENGIRLDRFTARDKNISSKANRFLFVGEVTESKGIDELLIAASRLNQDFTLEIVGGGQIEHFAKRASELGINSNVQFKGVLVGDALINSYAAADIFVMPSHAEGMPLSILEAMAMKLSVIASDVGSISEVVPSDGGIIIPTKNTESLTSAMMSIIGKHETIETHGNSNRKRIEERFSFDRVVTDIRAIYDELISQRK